MDEALRISVHDHHNTCLWFVLEWTWDTREDDLTRTHEGEITVARNRKTMWFLPPAAHQREPERFPKSLIHAYSRSTVRLLPLAVEKDLKEAVSPTPQK